MSVRQRLIAAACALVCAAAAWAQGVIVCRACGREAKPGETACSHCSAALPKPRDEAPPAPPAPDPALGAAEEVARAAAAVVRDSVRQAREAEKQRPEVALSYYQNALALSRLLQAGALPSELGESILAGCERTKQALLRGQVPCRVCNGSGKYQLDMGKVDRKQGVKGISGLACPACKGEGSLPGLREISKVKMSIQQGRQEFERRQMLAGEVRLGRALVPAALEGQLSNRQRALVMTGVPVPCGACQLTGRQRCSACEGTGWTECDSEDCENGALRPQRQTGGSYSRTRTQKLIGDEPVKKCPRCEGLGDIPCVACKGSGSVVCKVCDGSGQAKRCTRCTGTGLASCAKCKGTGELKGKPCPECKGEKMSLCSACRGEGAVAR